MVGAVLELLVDGLQRLQVESGSVIYLFERGRRGLSEVLIVGRLIAERSPLVFDRLARILSRLLKRVELQSSATRTAELDDLRGDICPLYVSHWSNPASYDSLAKD